MKYFFNRKIANIFTVAFVYQYQEAFIVYPFSKQEESFYGTKRSYQRFEQCLQFTESNLNLAFNVMIAEKLFDNSVEAAVIKIAKEVANDLDIAELTFSVFFSDYRSNVTKVNEAYKNLQLRGSESFVEMFIEINKLNRNQKLVLERKANHLGKKIKFLK